MTQIKIGLSKISWAEWAKWKFVRRIEEGGTICNSIIGYKRKEISNLSFIGFHITLLF